jgi:hypothetical protein
MIRLGTDVLRPSGLQPFKRLGAGLGRAEGKNDCIDLYHFDVHLDDCGPQVIHQIKFVEHLTAESADKGGELNVTSVESVSSERRYKSAFREPGAQPAIFLPAVFRLLSLLTK